VPETAWLPLPTGTERTATGKKRLFFPLMNLSDGFYFMFFPTPIPASGTLGSWPTVTGKKILPV